MTRVLPVLLVLAGFGPYLIAQKVRTEHVLLYGLLPLAIAWLAVSARTILQRPPIAVQAAFLMVMLAWGSVVTVLVDAPAALSVSTAARAESLMQPLAVLLVLSAFVRVDSLEEADSLLRRCCLALVAALAANACMILVHLALNVPWIFEPFLPAGSASRGTVWERALSHGRYLGVFNQAFDSGLTYSFGLLAWVYLERTSKTRNVWLLLALPPLIAGALASVSKVSLVIGNLLFLSFFVSGWRIFDRLMRPRTLALITVTMIGLSAGVFWSDKWRGAEKLIRLLMPYGDNLIARYTAGRFGSSGRSSRGEVVVAFERVASESALGGLGFARRMVVDNAFLDMYVMAGFIGLVAYTGILATIGILGARHSARSMEGRFLFFAFLLILGASIGGPVITANRFAPAFWAIFAMIAVHLHYSARSRAQAETA